MTEAEERRISLLRPEVQQATRLLLTKLDQAGMRYQVGETYRSAIRQDALYKDGTKTSNKVSWHQLRRAVHIILVDPKTGKLDMSGSNEMAYRTLAGMAELCGFRQIGWRGDGSKWIHKTHAGKAYWDPFHFEFRGPHKTLQAAVAAEAPDLKSQWA